jgi:flagellar basal body-associated protein FliL
MARKASLDILEIESSEPLNVLAPKDEAPEEGSASAPAPAVLKKKRFLKFWIVSGSVAAVILTASVFWLVLRGPESAPQSRRIQAGPEARISGAMANLLGFYVDLRDDQGRIRILACDVRLVISDREDPERLEARPDLRIAIYRAVQGISYARLVDPMGFQHLKTAVFREMKRMLGPGVVYEVYLTNFLLM